MLIALDFDDTYTRDHILWDDFIQASKERGHKVIIVTMRYENEGQQIRHYLGKEITIIFTGRQAKKPFCEQIDVFPDIWIDDRPEYLLNDSIYT